VGHGEHVGRLSLEIEETGRARQIGLHLFAAALVHNLPSHCVANVGQAVARRNQLASHVVDAFAKHNLNPSSMHVPTRTAHWPVLRFVITVFDRPWNP